MTPSPTYTAEEIRHKALTLDVESFRILIELIEEELDLYTPEEVAIIMQASMILFTRSLLKFSWNSLE